VSNSHNNHEIESNKNETESDSSKDEKLENNNDMNLKLNEFLSQNTKMFEDVTRMMQTIGLHKTKID
jgi:hypothetical protein